MKESKSVQWLTVGKTVEHKENEHIHEKRLALPKKERSMII